MAQCRRAQRDDVHATIEKKKKKRKEQKKKRKKKEKRKKKKKQKLVPIPFGDTVLDTTFLDRRLLMQAFATHRTGKVMHETEGHFSARN